MINTSGSNNINPVSNIEFAEKHIGGSINDSINSFNNQSNIVVNSDNDYQRVLDYNNKIDRDKNKNDNYVERLDNEQRTTVYRINNYPTYVDDINISNPVIYPKDYDMYFNYLNEKNLNPINTQVVKTKNYINIDAANRNIKTYLNISQYINLNDYSLEFTNQSNYLKIYLNDAKSIFKPNDFMILRGFKNYEIFYSNLNFFFNNGSTTVILDLKPNFDESIPYYDIFIGLNDVVANDNLLFWKNIPLNLINQLHKVYIINTNDDVRLAFDLPIIFYSENDSNKTLISNCTITYYNLGNYPINLINSNTPITTTNLNDYFIINNVGNNYIELILTNAISINQNIILDGIWTNNIFKTGKNIQIGKINGFVQGFINPNNFVINLDKSYSNICSIKIVSSEIPNVQQNITVLEKDTTPSVTDTNLKYIQNKNNKLYWQNILDNGIYQIELEPGYYLYDELKNTIETKVSLVKRNFLYNSIYLSEYNSMVVEFDQDTNITKFNLFDIYNLPNCLDSLTQPDSTSNFNFFVIKINQDNHNLKKGDKIFITGSLDYFTIKSDYINTPLGHEITNVINNNFYEITIKNINEISNVGNTKGGYEIKIKTFAVFRLFFNFDDTFGSLMGFSFTGNSNAITNYSNTKNNYTITNIEPYYVDIGKVLIVNNKASPFDLVSAYSKQNSTYILLLAENFNNNYNPNGPSYFYKFLLNGQPNSYLYNTFVQSPIYFNPPIKTLNSFKFTFILPNGGLVNFGNLNPSFTLEITTLINLPENTNITTYMSRI